MRRRSGVGKLISRGLQSLGLLRSCEPCFPCRLQPAGIAQTRNFDHRVRSQRRIRSAQVHLVREDAFAAAESRSREGRGGEAPGGTVALPERFRAPGGDRARPPRERAAGVVGARARCTSAAPAAPTATRDRHPRSASRARGCLSSCPDGASGCPATGAGRGSRACRRRHRAGVECDAVVRRVSTAWSGAPRSGSPTSREAASCGPRFGELTRRRAGASARIHFRPQPSSHERPAPVAVVLRHGSRSSPRV